MANEIIKYAHLYKRNSAQTYYTDIVSVEDGGTGASNSEEAIRNLGGVSIYDIDLHGGPVSLDRLNKINLDRFPVDEVIRITGGVKADGATLVTENIVYPYKITNYNSFINYHLEHYTGSDGVTTYSEIDHDIIYMTCPEKTRKAGFYINGQLYLINTDTTPIQTPKILNISYNQESVPLSVYFYVDSSPFTQTFEFENLLTHVSSDWQIALDPNFKVIVAATSNNTTSLTRWKLPATLRVSTRYYIRVRYMADNGEYSKWSPLLPFTTSRLREVYNYYDGIHKYDGSIDFSGTRYIDY